MTRYLLLCFVLLQISCKNNSDKKKVNPVITIETTKVLNEDLVINGDLFFPEGFSAIVVVDSIGPSRHIAVNANGDIYAKLREPNGTNGNMALRDTSGNGVADIKQRFGNYPNDGTFATEMRIHNGYLYFSSEQVIYRQKLNTNQLIPEGNPEVILTDYFPKRWHNAKSLAFDKKGNMYVTFSAPTNACEDPNSVGQIKGMNPCPGVEVLGSIWKFDENRLNQSQQDGQLYATGIRSMVAISWNDEDNTLYGLQHGRDYLHNHAPQYFSKWDQAVLPSEEFMKIEEGDNFGWPYSYYDHFKNKKLIAPEYGGDGKKEATDYKNPIMGLPAHWAPNDLLFYKGDAFPERYKQGAFIAFHGSMNRTPYPQAGYIVAFIPFNNGKPTGEWEVFADGFAGKDTIVTMPDAKYRPMGLAEGPDGSLFISESKQGKIWKVSFNGNKSEFGEEQLQEMEKAKSKSYLKIPEKLKNH
ncbi:glucose/arabinose dehydrogenase [Maribacter spongiicola]|uniref:Glucose/arabinose dehydrogenase n=1 Tax=Maribacter spongiicola TaxID=1206753 RepID=A0A4V3ESF5_9FLAO|nr:PQQ-dependent sugar dehydrogenase [Maribacter spongiicola]TDT47053.1 glucose/arabinose dehydrogenase [Maribacter spongiicola]